MTEKQIEKQRTKAEKAVAKLITKIPSCCKYKADVLNKVVFDEKTNCTYASNGVVMVKLYGTDFDLPGGSELKLCDFVNTVNSDTYFTEKRECIPEKKVLQAKLKEAKEKVREAGGRWSSDRKVGLQIGMHCIVNIEFLLNVYDVLGDEFNVSFAMNGSEKKPIVFSNAIGTMYVLPINDMLLDDGMGVYRLYDDLRWIEI